MGKLKEKNLVNKIILCLACALSIFMIVIMAISLGKTNSTKVLVDLILGLIIFAFAIYYAVYAYKRPHGRDMKILMLGFSLFVAIGVLPFDGKEDFTSWPVIVRAVGLIVCSVFVAHMAGRLKKVEENKIVGIIILVVLIVVILIKVCVNIVPDVTANTGLNMLSPNNVITASPDKVLTSSPNNILPAVEPAPSGEMWYGKVTSFWCVVLWFDIFVAYLTRFKEHRKAKFDDERKSDK